MSEKPLSLKEKMERAKRDFDPAAIGERLVEQQETVDAGTIGYLGELIGSDGGADKVGLSKLCEDMPAKEARQEWFNLSLAEIQERLKEWAKEIQDIRPLVHNLGDFLLNRFVADSAWQVIVTVERPCRLARSEDDLFELLQEFARSGLAIRAVNPRRDIEDGVAIQRGDARFVFAPKKQPPDAPQTRLQLGWQFVKKAKAEFDAHQQKLDALKARSTLNAAEALAGDIGTVYVPMGTQCGILFETQNGGDVRILDTVDVEVGQLPTDWFCWDDCKHLGADVVQAVAKLTSQAKKS
ncbi:MAG: hypothetical protein ABSF55_01550 [Candidatus Staskawiczbacteria bacterium]|jgi:hypothetical protein